MNSLPGPPASARPVPPALARLVTAGAETYQRGLVLPRLLPIGPDDLVGDEPALGRRLCARLARALRAERNRGRAGHWSYDLNRHIALMQALKAERRALVAGRPRAIRARPPAPSAVVPPDLL